MPDNSQQIVQKLQNCLCNILRDDGVGYEDYIEQLSYLLFLKMADEQAKLLKKLSIIPFGFDWQSLLKRDGDKLKTHYENVLKTLGRDCYRGTFGIVFCKAKNKIQDPAKLKYLIEIIDNAAWG